MPLGDTAVLVVFAGKNRAATGRAVGRLARALNHEPLAGVTDIVPSFATVTVHYEPAKIAAGAGDGMPWAKLTAWILNAAERPARAAKAKDGRRVVVPVCYGGEQGPDLAAVAAHAKLTEDAVIRAHTGATFQVAAIGFSPGFPYLLGLPARLAVPRRATPRLTVPAGSVAIGGDQAGIYPTETPGGWSLIGRTPLRLFRAENEAAPTLLEPGDTVKFVAITEAEAEAAKRKEAVSAVLPKKTARAAATVEVIKAGGLTTVQDLGRAGRQHLGIPVGGAMDRQAARVANLLLGNDENAPLLEGMGTGPELKFFKDTWIAVTGASVRDVAGWRPLRVTAGQVVSLAPFTQGTCVYVAIAGGFDVARVLGGAGTLLRAGIGGWNGRALKAGDRLATRPGGFETTGDWMASDEFRTVSGTETTVRFVKGPQWDEFDAASRRAFATRPYRITAKSDRMGLRLTGEALRVEEARELASEGVGFGSVQVPPDGNPIVLMADRQTIGGYTKIGDVISVDLPKLAQARAGGLVRFWEIGLDEAHRLYLERERALALLGAGVRAKLRFPSA